MICEQCKKEGKTSTVHLQSSSSTLLAFTPYYDEKGVYHSHDPNTHTMQYQCSNGHFFTEESKAKCPNCNAFTFDESEGVLDGNGPNEEDWDLSSKLEMPDHKPTLAFVAMNIVNQILDEAGTSVAKRQQITDTLDTFVRKLIMQYSLTNPWAYEGAYLIKRITDAMEAKSWDAEDVALAIGVTTETVEDWLTGKTDIEADILYLLEEPLGIKILSSDDNSSTNEYVGYNEGFPYFTSAQFIQECMLHINAIAQPLAKEIAKLTAQIMAIRIATNTSDPAEVKMAHITDIINPSTQDVPAITKEEAIKAFKDFCNIESNAERNADAYSTQYQRDCFVVITRLGRIMVMQGHVFMWPYMPATPEFRAGPKLEYDITPEEFEDLKKTYLKNYNDK